MSRSLCRTKILAQTFLCRGVLDEELTSILWASPHTEETHLELERIYGLPCSGWVACIVKLETEKLLCAVEPECPFTGHLAVVPLNRAEHSVPVSVVFS